MSGLAIGERFKSPRGLIPMTSFLLACLVCPGSSWSSRERWLTDRYKRIELNRERLQAARALVEDGRKVRPSHLLAKDRSWQQLSRTLTELSRSHELIAWARPLLFVIGGCPLGICPHAVFQAAGQDVLIAVRDEQKPSLNDVRALNAWVAGGCAGLYPDSIFARDVFEVNLQRLAWEQELKNHAVDRTHISIMFIYCTPKEADAVVRTLEHQYVLLVVHACTCVRWTRIISCPVCILDSCSQSTYW
jgi:hypothetical protein